MKRQAIYGTTEKARTNAHAIQLCHRQARLGRFTVAHHINPANTAVVDRTSRQRRYEYLYKLRQSMGWFIEGLIPKRWKYKLSAKYKIPTEKKPRKRNPATTA